MLGTVISYNVIREEDVDIAVNTPAEVDIHLNDLGGDKIGVADVCAFDKATVCTGTINATLNYWGCTDGPGRCRVHHGQRIRYQFCSLASQSHSVTTKIGTTIRKDGGTWGRSPRLWGT